MSKKLTLRLQLSEKATPSVTSGHGSALLLFDGDTATGFFPGWNASDYPAKLTVDLGKTYKLDKIRVFDGPGQPNLKFYAGQEVAGDPFLTVVMDMYQTWRPFPVYGRETRFVTVVLDSMQGENVVTEIEFWGEPTDAPPPPPPPGGGGDDDGVIVLPRADAAEVICANSFAWVPTSLVATGKERLAMVREYGYIQFLMTPEKLYMFEPSHQANTNYDSHYRELKNAGVEAVPCLNKVPLWLAGSNPEGMDARFHEQGADALAPESYRLASEMGFQMAARYGRAKHAESVLKVAQTPRWDGDPVNQKLSGLDLLNWIEGLENEAERPWKTPDGKYTPEQLAAHMSAVYDGHEGRLGAGCGIKTADPSMKVALPGLVSMNLPFLDKMLAWFKANRTDGKFAADCINFHHYCNRSNNPNDTEVNLLQGAGVSPERDKLKDRLVKIVAWTRRNAAHCEAWFSEFGYDTTPPPGWPNHTWLAQYAQVYGSHTAEELQARWIVRSYLESIAAGVDRAFVFTMIDENEAHTGSLYTSSGLATGMRVGSLTADGESTERGASMPGESFIQRIKAVPVGMVAPLGRAALQARDSDPQAIAPPLTPKPAHGAVMALIAELRGYQMDGNLSTSVARIYRFRGASAVKYFYWSPTAADLDTPVHIAGKNLVAREWVQVVTVPNKRRWFQPRVTKPKTVGGGKAAKT